MKTVILILSLIFTVLFFEHEFDACYRGEWKMMKFLRKFSNEQQYLIFLYMHIPLVFFFLYYMWTVINFSNFYLWIAVNVFGLLHFIMHLIGTKWKSNVYKTFHSYSFIYGIALLGLLNLVLVKYY